MSVEEKRGRQALAYLNRLGNSGSGDPVMLELRARAMSLAGECSEASEITSKLENHAAADWRVHFSAGAIYAGCKLYVQAEASFSRALDAEPRNFDILYNLGLAALHAGHTERATSVFEVALNERPDDADCLHGLSQAYLQGQRPVDAAALLTKAERLAPGRTDILLLLAQVSAQLEFYQDAAATYDRYLKLKPADEVARRERSFVLASDGQYQRALPDLERYVHGHPRDGMGFYELAIAQAYVDRSKAIESLDHALTLDALLTQARYTRAVLKIEDGNPAAAIGDLQILRDRDPSNHHVLVRLGQAYLALDRAGDAAHVLKRALELAPSTPSVLTVYLRAVEKLGDKQEAAVVQSQLKQFGTSRQGSQPRAGLIDYLSLSPAEQRARYLANLRKSIATDPADIRWRIRQGKELLADGKTAEALEAFRDLKSAPEADRRGDYYLLRAQLLDSLGKIPEAAEALNRGMQEAPTKASLYFQAASFLLKHHQNREALDLLEQANRIVPDTRELLLAQWVTLILLQHDIDAKKLLSRIQARWPEWDHPYLLNGIFLEMLLLSTEARQSLETAIALGANTPEVYYYQALAITHSAPEDMEAAENAITRALALASKDPWAYLLAGKISLVRKDYSAAIRRLLEATHLEPRLIPARYALRNAYQALGDEQKSAAELEEIKRIGQENAVSDQRPVADFLFTVRPPM